MSEETSNVPAPVNTPEVLKAAEKQAIADRLTSARNEAAAFEEPALTKIFGHLNSDAFQAMLGDIQEGSSDLITPASRLAVTGFLRGVQGLQRLAQVQNKLKGV